MYSLIYITTKNITKARKISQHLVNNRLVACCNIVQKIESVYWGSDDYFKKPSKITKDTESLVICKTKSNLVEKIIKEVKKIHSYTVPCIISWKIEKGNPDFLNWISKETKDD